MTRRKCFFEFAIIILSVALFVCVASASEDITELEKKAELGDAEAQYQLGRWYDSRFTISCWPFTTNDNLQEAVKWWFKAAKQGHVRAQYELGHSYSLGLGVKKDQLEAAKWYHKAAETGFAPAQNALGSMYSMGEGVPLDEVEAVKWWLKAAEQGVHPACYRLGKAYAEGLGVTQNREEAIKWLRKADIYPPAKKELAKILAAE